MGMGKQVKLLRRFFIFLILTANCLNLIIATTMRWMRWSLIFWGLFLVLLSSGFKFGNGLTLPFESSGSVEVKKYQQFFVYRRIFLIEHRLKRANFCVMNTKMPTIRKDWVNTLTNVVSLQALALHFVLFYHIHLSCSTWQLKQIAI